MQEAEKQRQSALQNSILEAYETAKKVGHSIHMSFLYINVKTKYQLFETKTAHIYSTTQIVLKNYSEDPFHIIGRAESQFHLGNFGIFYIKIMDPILCRYHCNLK